MASTSDRVPGHSDATYGPVPKEQQLLTIEFLEIAPTPILSDRVFFAYLRGYISEDDQKKFGLTDEGLVDATLTISASIVYPNGRREEIEPMTGPLQTTSFNSIAHFVIRDVDGDQVDFVTKDGGDLLLDFQMITEFMESGTWTFRADARLGDESNTCLFAVSVTQWLDGDKDDD